MDKLVEEGIEAFAVRVNKYMNSLLQLFLQENESINKRIDAIEAKFKEKEKACQNNKTKLTDLHTKIWLLANHVENLIQPEEEKQTD